MQKTTFWKHKKLDEMSTEEWEALCDGCGKCCVLKLEDIDSGDVYYTDVGCKLLNCDTCVCTDYTNRTQIVPDCVILTPDNLADLKWMPTTCAYRLIYENQDLPEWHPLVSGDKTAPAHRAMRLPDASIPKRMCPKPNCRIILPNGKPNYLLIV